MTEHFLSLRVYFYLFADPCTFSTEFMYDLFISGIPENQPVGEPNIYVIVVNKQNLNECRAYAIMIKWGKKTHHKIRFCSNLNVFSYKFWLTFFEKH